MRQDGGIDQLDPGIGAVRQGPYPAIAEGLDGYPRDIDTRGTIGRIGIQPETIVVVDGHRAIPQRGRATLDDDPPPERSALRNR